MKATVYLFATLLLLTSCGERTRRIVENQNTDSERVEGLLPNPSAENHCTLEPFGNDNILKCEYLTLLIEGNVLGKAHQTDLELVLVASKKNGGTGGSQWVDTTYELDQPSLLALPSSIPAVGNAGNGQKLYIKFNDSIDCVWFSHAQTSYQDHKCYRNAVRAPSLASGFSEGEELTINEIEDVEKVEMHVNGAQGDGVITTASAVFVII